MARIGPGRLRQRCQAGERRVHARFADRRFAPSQIDRSMDETLAHIRAALAAAG